MEEGMRADAMRREAVKMGIHRPEEVPHRNPPPVRDKQTMYRLLAAGVFGNTTEQHFSLFDWVKSGNHWKYHSWGVRTLIPGGPCRLYCPTLEVRETVELPEFKAAGVNISVMVDAVCDVTLWADVWDSPRGLYAYGIEYPPKGGSWRALMPEARKDWEGVAARNLLRKHLNPNSLADLEAVFDLYPGHVVELSALDRCIGTVPLRNAVVWEVRDGTHGY